ncbi:MAG: methionine adenosyltransferase [Patescibacteria group bacterium]|jgi:S-adenosylmethionine synthetase
MFVPKTYSVESVTAGHPDKVCDQISDAILSACAEQDPSSRVAVETLGSHGLLVLAGEITTRAKVDYAAVAKQTYKDIGYDDELKVITHITQQSPDIAQGVDTGGAGDQGIMYGFATNETPEFLPRGLVFARALTDRLTDLRQSGEVAWLKPDGKSQVTIVDGLVTVVVVSCQHAEEVLQDEIRRTIIEYVIDPVIPAEFRSPKIEFLINTTGRFVLGGFTADTGLTGRKLMVDSYGGIVPHGGGATSGKDMTKVDRSAAMKAREVAKAIVKRGDAKECLVSVAYAIGKVEPVMLFAVNENGEDISAKLAEWSFEANKLKG